MSVDVSVVGVLLAALSAMVIGSLWYSPALFGKQWTKATGVTDKEMKKNMGPIMVAMVMVSLVTAYVLSFFIAYAHHFNGGSWLKAGVETSLMAWVGLAATAVFAHGLFEPKGKNLLFINAGNRLATLLAMGLILGAFMK